MKPLHRALLLVALAILAARFAWEVLHALDVFADYHAYYRAAANLRAGADIYAEGRLLVAHDDFDFWTQTDGQYVYPPALAIALLPLTALDIGKGGPVWLLALVLATLALPWLIARLLGRTVGPFSLLTFALPVWALLPLALGIRYGLVAWLPVVLVAILLATYLRLSHLPATTPPSPRSGYPPQWVWSPPQRRGEVNPLSRAWQHIADRPLTLVLPVLALLILALGWRGGQIDAFLFKLAAPGLVGTTLLPWLRRAPFHLAAPSLSDLDNILPLALPVLGATPLLLGLRFGQADVLLLLLTTLALLAHLGQRDILAGVALGAAAAVKPTLALYGLYYLKKRAWGTLCAAALTGATLGLAPFFLLGRAAFADWFAISRYFTGERYPAYPNNQSLRGLLLRAFVGGPGYTPLLVSRPLAQAIWLLAVAVALLIWYRAVSPQHQQPQRAATEYALTTALLFFAAPLSEDIHYVALLLPLALLADRLLRAQATPRWRILASGGLLAFLPPLADLAARIGGGNLLRLVASAPYLYGLLLVIAALLATLPHEHHQPTPT